VLPKNENHPIVQTSDRLLPILSNQKMNCYLKEFEDICDIKKKLTMQVAKHTFATLVSFLIIQLILSNLQFIKSQ